MIAPERTGFPVWWRRTRRRSPFAARTIRLPEGGEEATMASSCSSAPSKWSAARNKLTLGRLRLAPIADFARNSLHVFIGANTAPGSIVKTDGLAAYLGPPNVTHEPHVVGTMAAHVVLPGIHRVFANLKTWALGVYHGLRRKHLTAYLDEFVFQFNRRHTRHAGLCNISRKQHCHRTNSNTQEEQATTKDIIKPVNPLLIQAGQKLLDWFYTLPSKSPAKTVSGQFQNDQIHLLRIFMRIRDIWWACCK